MAVNLLSLARQLGGSLHSTPRKGRSSGRSSYQNQPSNLQRGTHIPGTNIEQGSGLGKKGRTFGGVKDTKIRSVKGQPSHVNTAEARAIDTLGPIGEAWVQSIGSGTINPKTGLREYGLFKSNPFKRGGALNWKTQSGASVWSQTWKPSAGKWGPFGHTRKSRERDAFKLKSQISHAQFEQFRRDYEDENIAAMFTATTDDDTPKTSEFTGSQGFEQFITEKSGLNPSTNDIRDYTDVYDTRHQTENTEKLKGDLVKAGIGTENIGTTLQSGVFGLLTESADNTATKNFAGRGEDFATQFAEKQLIKEAESKFDVKDVEVDQLRAESVSGVEDLQDKYNQKFWNNMVSWDTAVNT